MTEPTSPAPREPAPAAPTRRRRPLLALALSALFSLLLADGFVRLVEYRAGRPATPSGSRTVLREIVAQMVDIDVKEAEAQGEQDPEEALDFDPEADEEPGGEPLTRREQRLQEQREKQRQREKTQGAKRGAYVLHPYAGYVTTVGYVLIDRTVEAFTSGKYADTCTVMIMGGSVAANFAGLERGANEVVEEGLRALPAFHDRPVKILRFAVAGYRQPQQLELLAYLLSRGCRPTIVVNLDGLNEVRIGENNATHGIPPTWPSVGHWANLAAPSIDQARVNSLVEMGILKRQASERLEATLSNGTLYSAYLAKRALSDLLRLRGEWVAAQEHYVELAMQSDRGHKSSPFGEREMPEDPIADSISCWEESSFAMHTLCAAYGLRYVHLLQPTLHDPGSKPISAKERAKGLEKGEFDARVVRGYEMLRRGMAALAARGVETHDTSYLFEHVEDELYFDSCHFNKQGNVILAHKLVELLGAG